MAGLHKIFTGTALLFAGLCCTQKCLAQQPKTDSSKLVVSSELLDERHSDSLRKARIRRTILHSAYLPGWGQINNGHAWKTPVVVGGLGVIGYIFFDNLKTYRELRQSYILKIDTFPANDVQIPDRYKLLSANSLKFYRDQFRKNVDYSVLAFIIGWGLNVVDAAVYAHLKDFDVSDKLSMRIKPGINPMGQSTVALVFTIK